MELFYHTTVKNPVEFSGVGIHSGDTVTMKVEPARQGTGVVFRNADVGKGEIKVSPYNVVNTLNAVTLSNGKWKIQTVEHFLASLFALKITDLYVELDYEEIPIMDGSSMPFYRGLYETGLRVYDEEIAVIQLRQPLSIIEKDKYLIALPSEHLSVQYRIDFPHKLLSNKMIRMDLNTEEVLVKEILPARTFGFIEEVEAMKSKGLIRGASLENAVVLSKEGYLNESLRFEDECVRHKILDLIGDLYLLGRPLRAQILASKAGHALDVKLACMILEQISLAEGA